jgi:Protein of unknown function DUF2625
MSLIKRSLKELINREDPAWPLVEEWIATATRPVEVLPPSADAGDALVALQVTTGSPMGAIVLETGGILVDHGWIRILGSGHRRLPRSLPSWSFACGLQESDAPPPFLLVADDVVGGFFAQNGGHFGPGGPNVWYFAPDTWKWEDLGVGYSQFVSWCFSGDVPLFYEGYRWPGWEADTARLGGDLAFHLYPPLTAAGPPLAERSRRAIPVSEIYALYVAGSR